jgi:hypothetical protein
MEVFQWFDQFWSGIYNLSIMEPVSVFGSYLIVSMVISAIMVFVIGAVPGLIGREP